MTLLRARLYHVRNYLDEVFFFHPQMNLILGNNAQGKTNLLESIYCACIGKPFRTPRLKDLLMQDEEVFELRLIFKEHDKEFDFRLRGSAKDKVFLVNQVKLEKRSALFGRFPMVLFAPEHLRMIQDGPSARRAFLDRELSLLHKPYFHALVSYNKILASRNALLRDPDYDPAMLQVYNEQLVRYGTPLFDYRKQFIAELSARAAEVHHDLSGGQEELRLGYESDLLKGEDFLHKLTSTVKRDHKFGSTGFGIHLDDFSVKINQVDVRRFGSQGQVRLSALSIFLALIPFIEAHLDTKPIILLDDVFSELDQHRRRNILKRLKNYQTIITATDTDGLDLEGVQAHVITIRQGKDTGGLLEQQLHSR